MQSGLKQVPRFQRFGSPIRGLTARQDFGPTNREADYDWARKSGGSTRAPRGVRQAVAKLGFLSSLPFGPQ